MWEAAHPKLKALGVIRAVGGMKMRWCRGLRKSSRIDERRRKNENNLLTALQVRKKGELGVGRGKSTIYGNMARAQKERKRQMEEQERDELDQEGEVVGDVDVMDVDDDRSSGKD